MQRTHRRSTKVCMRCRKRKTKCDFKFPACTSCKLANVECVGFDPTTKEAVPRSLVRSLEARVAELEAQTLAFRDAPQNVPNAMSSVIGRATMAPTIPASTAYLRSRISSGLLFQPSCPPLAIVRDRPQQQPQPQPQTVPLPGNKYGNAVIDLGSIPASAIERIVENYASTHLPQYPCISPAMLADIVQRAKNTGMRDKAYGLPGSTGPDHFECFVLFIVLAISAMTLTWKDDEQARRASESFYNSSISHLQQLDDASEIHALQISLLLAHYAHMCPERLDNWTCIANAVRIVLHLGLFQQCPDNMPPQQARQRTELFWVAYGMERSLCTNLRLPLSFPEEVITANLDLPPEVATSAAAHIRRYRSLETEVHRVLHLEEPLDRFGYLTVDGWLEDVTGRLREWYAAAQGFTRHNMLEFRHIQFQHLRARLHRPTPRLRVRSPADRQIVLEAARILVEDYLDQQHHSRLFYPWHGVHILFETALIALEACWSSRDSPPLRAHALQILELCIPRCLAVILRIGERWHAAATCAHRLQPLTDKVRAAFVHPHPSASSYAADLSITEEIQGLLFSDRPLVWNRQHHTTPHSLLGFDESPLAPAVFGITDDLELFQWDPDWSIVPAESVDETAVAADALLLSSEAHTISSLLSLPSAMEGN